MARRLDLRNFAGWCRKFRTAVSVFSGSGLGQVVELLKVCCSENPESRTLTYRSLTDRAVRIDAEGETRFVAVAGRGGVLYQPHIIRQNISRNCTRRILVAGVLIVHSEGYARVDRDIRE